MYSRTREFASLRPTSRNSSSTPTHSQCIMLSCNSTCCVQKVVILKSRTSSHDIAFCCVLHRRKSPEIPGAQLFLIISTRPLCSPHSPTSPLPLFFCNDPSAGSPTETLLRLLLPLNGQVCSSLRPATPLSPPCASPKTSLNHSIGSIDGRCVQRTGT